MSYGFREFLLSGKFSAGSFGVIGEIKGTPVGTANTLDPAVACVALSVPAVARVMSHLIAHVLTEAEPLGTNPHHHEELVDTAHEVAQGFVAYQLLQDNRPPW